MGARTGNSEGIVHLILFFFLTTPSLALPAHTSAVGGQAHEADGKRKDRGTEWATSGKPFQVGVGLLIPVLFMLEMEAEQ